MNCSRFRFLIQQWFDTELSPQDERMVVAHIDTCESCARFQHQLDQVIQGTPDVPLPDECLPSNLEALAKRIMVEIPQEKPGFMSMLKGLFPFLGGGASGGKQTKKEKGKKSQQQQLDDEMESSNSGFPHVRRKPLMDQQPDDGGMVRGKRGVQADDDLMATSTRLKSLQKLQPANEDPQAMTSGRLGGRFGVNLPDRDQQQEGAGMNLAESIRRKVAESGQGEGFGADSGGFPVSNPPQSFGQGSGGFGGNQFEQQNSGFGQPPAMGGGQPGFGSNSGSQPAFGGPSGGQPGMVGQWGQAASAPAPQPSGGGWGDPPVPGVGGDSDWKPTPPSPDWGSQGGAQGGWGGGNSQPQPAAQTQGGQQPGWGSSWPEDNKSQDWGKPGQSGDSWKAQPQPANDGWGAPSPAPANDGWGAPKSGGDDGWNSGSAGGGSGWGSAPAQPAAQTGGWGAPPVPAPAQQGGWGSGAPAANDGWGAPPAPANNNDGWGAPPTPANNNDGWGAPPTPANNNDGWGAPPTPAANDGWGAPAASNDSWGAQKPAATTGQNSAWGNPAPNDGWTTPVQAQQAPAAGGWSGGGAAQDSGWGAPQPQPAAASDGWSTPAAQQQGGWGQPAAAQPAAQGGGWGQPPQPNDGWGQPNPQTNSGSNRFITSAPAPAAPAPAQAQPSTDADAWSEEGEQIQTGMWQAFTLDEPALGTPKNVNQSMGSRPAMPPPGAGNDANRWDTPIQQRAPEPADEGNRWDVPISERMKQQQAAPQAPAAPAADRWDTPIQQRPQEAVAQAPQQEGQPNSIMDRLSSILGDDLTAMAGGQPAAPAQAAAPMAPPPAPPAPPPVAAPPVVPQPAAPAADVSQFDIPIQERMKQAGQAPEPVAAGAGGLFKLDDQAIDKVFSNIGVNDKLAATAAAPAPAANMAATPVPPPVPVGAPAAVPPPAPPMQPSAQQPPRPPVPPVAPPVVPGAPKISPVPPRNAAPAAPSAPMAPQAPAPAPAPVAAPAQGQQQAGMFHLDDSAMDKIFAQNLGVNEAGAPQAAAPQAPMQVPPPVPPVAQQPPRPPVPPVVPPVGQPPQPAQGGWNAAPQQPVPQPQAPAPQAPAPQAPATARQPGQQGLFNVDDAAMDRIFNDLGVKEKPPAAVPKINVREAVSQIRNLADIPAPKVEGVGRLSREESNEPAAAGKINAIGKFLLDQQDLQKLGNLASSDLSDGKVRVLTHEASEEISKLLEHIATQPGVVGSVIVGHDGILIANSLPKELDPETIGILSLGIYVNTTNIAKKMGHNHLHQLVSRTMHGYLVVADFGGGILVTVSNGQDTEKLIPLMRSITQLVAQS